MTTHRILFMGTPDFAVPVLESLIQSQDEVVAVVTNPDRPAGRGKSPTPPPVKIAAQKAGVPVIQPRKIKTEEFRLQLAAYKPDICVVVAYGRILPQHLLDIPRLDCINVHASLLPALRGAAPINWSIVRGHTQTGVAIMRMEAGLDTGPVYEMASLDILPGETAGELHDRLKYLGSEPLLRVLDRLREGPVEPTEQNHDNSTYAPMMTKGDGDLDWTHSALDLSRRVLGFNPWPGAWTVVSETNNPKLENLRLKIHKAQPWTEEAPEGAQTDLPYGSVCYATGDILLVNTGKGLLQITNCQAPGRKALPTADFLRGCPLHIGARLAKTT